MGLIRKVRRVLRGEVALQSVALEFGRRGRVALARRGERAWLARQTGVGNWPLRLAPEFAHLTAAELLEHFRTRAAPRFLPGFEELQTQASPQELFPHETAQLIEHAREIAGAHRWSLLGYGVRDFGAEIDWLRDPLSGVRWPLAYHADVKLWRGDGSDARVLWELNRLAHLITLGRAYVLTNDASLAEEFFRQIESWRAQNPVGYGVNWNCAMEVALRAINLLAAFQLFRHAPELNQARLQMLLRTFSEHGTHIRRHLEFSYVTTSNHYLSDVVGLFWLGVCLPELAAAREWRAFGKREMLREMEKQILADGADDEAATGYHRLVLELFLYSFMLARANHIEIEARYWQRLRAMLNYVRAYLRPDGRAPLIGDTDSSQVLPLGPREAHDHAYLLALGAVIFQEPRFKITDEIPTELWWMLGAAAVASYRAQPRCVAVASEAFTEAGTYVMREGDLYLLLNACGAGLNGRGSHGHNDALSIEVSACGASLLADPGTYVYTSDFRERQLFRSTAYHSTVEIDGAEQNSTHEHEPFVIGDEARPRVRRWETNAKRDLIIAEHDGYRRFHQAPITHRRAVIFDKRARYWLIEDTLTGPAHATHDFYFRFHAAPTALVHIRPDGMVEVCDKMKREARLLIVALDIGDTKAELEPRWSSRAYGAKQESIAAGWSVQAPAPCVCRWALMPLCGPEDETKLSDLIRRLREDQTGFEAR